jgi:hypothetical protein
MGAVFLSYRRGDSEGQARALSLELVAVLGKESVFMDVDSIALGRDFRQVLQERLNSCDVMFALIGPGWLDAKDGTGKRYLESPTDYVRQEIAAALKRNIPVIPVLLQGAQVPSPERLPDDLKDLSYRNAFELGHSTWESDVREMLKRLGLTGPNTTTHPPRPSSADNTPPDATTGSLRFAWRSRRVAAVIALLVGIAALLTYRYLPKWVGVKPVAELSHPPQGSNETVLPRAGVETTPLPQASSAPGDGPASSGLEFAWPGDDCWDIFRGTELVTYQCGAKKQALGAGRYTIKGKSNPVFTPFTVDIRSGSLTRVVTGGVFDFAWPGDDCWDIFRGAELVTYQCGAKKQGLGAGRYTIKGKSNPVFTPFTVDIRNGSLTRVVMGGVFNFAWPGDDCWDIFRGPELVTYQCGAKKQALGAGRYTIKGKSNPVFVPFEIKIVDGAEVVKAP